MLLSFFDVECLYTHPLLLIVTQNWKLNWVYINLMPFFLFFRIFASVFDTRDTFLHKQISQRCKYFLQRISHKKMFYYYYTKRCFMFVSDTDDPRRLECWFLSSGEKRLLFIFMEIQRNLYRLSDCVLLGWFWREKQCYELEDSYLQMFHGG